jgi:hypothetical protein
MELLHSNLEQQSEREWNRIGLYPILRDYVRRLHTTSLRLWVLKVSNQMQEVMDAELAQAIALLDEANKLMESLFNSKEAD